MAVFLLVAIITAGAWLIRSNDRCKARPYIGLSESDAINKATEENRNYRVVEKDGQGFVVTEDLRPDRLNFQITNGMVTSIKCN